MQHNVQKNKFTRLILAALAAIIFITGTATSAEPVSAKTTTKTTTNTSTSTSYSGNTKKVTTTTTTTKTTTKTSTSKMKKKSKKTYKTKNKQISKKKSTKKIKNGTQTTTTTKYRQYSYKKNSKTKTKIEKTVKTVVKKTTTTTKLTPTPTPIPVKREVAVPSHVRAKLPSNVVKAWDTLDFKLYVDPTAQGWVGLFSAKNRSISVKYDRYLQESCENTTIYHEFGHFIAFVSGNTDMTTEWKNIWSEEKNSYRYQFNYNYETSTPAEFFASCYGVMVVNPSYIQQKCPKACAYINNAINSITDVKINRISLACAIYWSQNGV